MAVKSLVKIASPPSPISQVQPLLPSILLELVYSRLADASTKPLPSLNGPRPSAPQAMEAPVLSEQSVLILALIDSLPFLPGHELVDWLPTITQSLHLVPDHWIRSFCKDRLWEVLTSGEMDADRAAICAAWWSTKGGRALVLGDGAAEEREYLMSGALGEHSKL